MCLPEIVLTIDEWGRMQSERQAADDTARLMSFGAETARGQLAKIINDNLENAKKA